MYRKGFYSKQRLVGWTHRLWIKGGFIDGEKTRKSLDMAKCDAKKLAVKYLIGYGFEVVKELKAAGMLEEVLDEVGIETE